MNNKAIKSSQFESEVLKLINNYPEYKEEIEESSVVIFTQENPVLEIDERILGTELEIKIQELFNFIFSKDNI